MMDFSFESMVRMIEYPDKMGAGISSPVDVFQFVDI
jgi:hypothetical protein